MIKTKKIALVGAQSTGKTTLARYLANYYKTVWVPEYAREYFTIQPKRFEFSDVEFIINNQLQMESQAIKKANSYLFCDTDILTTLIWSDIFFNKLPDNFILLVQSNAPDLYLLLENDIKFVEEPQREDENLREVFYNKFKSYFKMLNLNYSCIKGTNSTRENDAIRIISNLN